MTSILRGHCKSNKSVSPTTLFKIKIYNYLKKKIMQMLIFETDRKYFPFILHKYNKQCERRLNEFYS